MVILETLTSYGPHVWYAAQLFWQEGQWMDFLRIKEIRRCPEKNWQPNVIHGRNSYAFTPT